MIWLIQTSLLLLYGLGWILVDSARIVSINKPFRKVYDPSTTTELNIVDIHDKNCPYEFHVKISNTGCQCNFQTMTMSCLYDTSLDKMPKLVRADSYNETFHQEAWILDFKCNRFEYACIYDSLMALGHIDSVDLSRDQIDSNCSIPIERGLLSIESCQFELPNASLHIGHLNLRSNALRRIRLHDKQLSLTTLDLSWNNIEQLNGFYSDVLRENHVDVCVLNISTLNLASNQLNQLDASLLIYVDHLDVSNNRISKFKINFIDKFKATRSQILSSLDFDCYFKNYFIANSSSLLSSSSSLLSSYSYFKWQNLTLNDTFHHFFFLSSLRVLDFSNNSLAYLPFSYLQDDIQFHSLESLNLNSNDLSTLNGRQFVNMFKLDRLELNNNNMSYLDEEAFYGLISLSYLDLSRNHLSEIQMHPNLFRDQINSLVSLNLDENRIEKIDENTFSDLLSVKYLYLNGNNLEELVAYSFGFMRNLQELYLSHNRIKYIDMNTFQIDKRSVIGPGLIEKLDLSYNHLSHLKSNIFSYLTNLRYLMLNNNQIRSIDKSTFHGNTHLMFLDLSLNRLSNLSFLGANNHSLFELRYLKMSNNEISGLRDNELFYMSSLSLLDLSSNRIEFIEDCAFHGIQESISKLYLNYNRITRLNSCAFMSNFHYLRFVQMLYNPLDCRTNCNFFFTVYYKPYSVNYEGIECSSNVPSLSNVTEHIEIMHCTSKQFEMIGQRCKQKLMNNKCFNVDFF